ncbi:MAG: prolyl-tRNA synthetase associated domain-containing protein [Oscillospiraceae bacterium]|nr:prolyl-tRNA synthetase associated domain-containing protein [Oscillospiraceae bacterium]
MLTVSEIFTTAPAGGLTEEQKAVFAALEHLQIPYERVEHDWANTMADCEAVSAVLGVDVCKNLVLCNRQKTQYYLLAMPSDKPFHTKDLSHQLGCARLSFAEPEAMETLLHVQPGSASILSLLFDTEGKVQLVIDRETKDCEYFSCHPCKSTGTLKLKTADVLQAFLPYTKHEPVTVDLPRW